VIVIKIHIEACFSVSQYLILRNTTNWIGSYVVKHDLTICIWSGRSIQPNVNRPFNSNMKQMFGTALMVTVALCFSAAAWYINLLNCIHQMEISCSLTLDVWTYCRMQNRWTEMKSHMSCNGSYNWILMWWSRADPWHIYTELWLLLRRDYRCRETICWL